MKTLKTKWFWWWGWDAEKLELWLEEKAADGWRLISVGTGGIQFLFQRDEPEKIRFGVDYQSQAEDDYLELFREDGWALVWSGAGGWYIWQKAWVTKRPEIYSDSASLILRNNRLTTMLRPIFVILVVIFGILLVNRRNFSDLLLWVYVFLIALYAWIFFQVSRYNRRLKAELRG